MEESTYIYILRDTLSEKNVILDELLELTDEQDNLIVLKDFDLDNFDDLMNKKETLIHKINQLDDGFEKVYSYVKETLSYHRMKYKEIIEEIQDLIRMVTDKSTKLQGKEQQLKLKIESNFSNRKKDIKDFKISSRTASSYYKNMADQFQGESVFLDKKK